MQGYGQADSKATKDRLLTKLTTALNLPYFPNCEKFMIWFYRNRCYYAFYRIAALNIFGKLPVKRTSVLTKNLTMDVLLRILKVFGAALFVKPYGTVAFKNSNVLFSRITTDASGWRYRKL